MRSIPLLDLTREYCHIKGEVAQALANCLEHQKWILGPEVARLENEVAAFLGMKHCTGTSSGTEALVVSLRALAIVLKKREYFEATDLIITTPFTFVATADAILRAGATPLFVDIDPVTFDIDPGQVCETVRNSELGGQIVGIVPVHLYGHPCDMEAIMAIAREYNLFVLEDVAQAFGALKDGKKLGSVGTAGAFSFFPSKNVGGFGDGGMIGTDSDELSDVIRMLITHGGKDKYNVDHIGYNARLDTLQAAVLLVKLHHVQERNSRRQQIASLYQKRLAHIGQIRLPVAKLSHGSEHVYHQYTIRVPAQKRNDVKEYLRKEGVETAIYYPIPLHKMTLFGGKRAILAGPLNEAEMASRTVLSLPIDPFLRDEEVLAVCDAIARYFSG